MLTSSFCCVVPQGAMVTWSASPLCPNLCGFVLHVFRRSYLQHVQCHDRPLQVLPGGEDQRHDGRAQTGPVHLGAR